MVNFKSLLSRLFCCLRVLNCFVLGRFGVGRLQIGHVALSSLWQFLRWGQSQDARGCLAVTDRFWLGNKTNHHSHLLHHFFQSCFLIEDRKRKHNKLPSFFFDIFWFPFFLHISWLEFVDIQNISDSDSQKSHFYIEKCSFSTVFPPFNKWLFDPHY